MLLLICIFCIHIYLQKEINSGKQVSKANLLVNLIHSFAYFYILSLALIGIIESKPFWMTLTDEKYNYWRNIFFYIFLVTVLIEPFIENKKITGKIYKIISSHVFLYIEVMIISVIAFCSIYGIQIINPTNVEWQMAFGEDFAQHYLGWKAYRSSQWHFPIGMIDNLAYPTLVSVMFTDSIPLLSVFFKIFSFALPEQFQFFGIWGLLCFVLQGCFAAKIMKRFTSSKWMIIDASILFVFTPAKIEMAYFSCIALADFDELPAAYLSGKICISQKKIRLYSAHRFSCRINTSLYRSNVWFCYCWNMSAKLSDK